MPVIEVFFDYTCPYCQQGLGYLRELLPDYPHVRIDWKPVEAHPRLEEPWYNPHVDLAVQGALFVKSRGGDERAYHERVLRAYAEERQALDDIEVLAACAGELGLPAREFRDALESGAFAKEQVEANAYAYGPQKVWAVPSLVCGEKRLDAVPNVGVTREQVKKLLEDCCVQP